LLWLGFFLLPGFCFSNNICQLNLQELIAREQPFFGQYTQARIRVAGIVVAMKANKVLLARRVGASANERGTWGLLGGRMEERDRDLVVATSREFKEEASLEIHGSRFEYLGRISYHGGDGYFYATYVFLLRLSEAEKPQLSDSEKQKLDRLEFFEPENLPPHLFSTNEEVLGFLAKHGWQKPADELLGKKPL